MSANTFSIVIRVIALSSTLIILRELYEVGPLGRFMACLTCVVWSIGTRIQMEDDMFQEFIAKLIDIGQAPVSHENFVLIQKIRSDILTAYTESRLTDLEKRHLYGISSIIMNKIRDELNIKS